MVEAQNKPAKSRKTGYLPSLDGWRAVAILGVLMTHDRPWSLFGYSSAAYKGYGGYGVYLFFAISGFLLTTRILEEEALCGYFDIRRFYIRRVFRIQPAALVYLGTVALLMLTSVIQDTWRSWLAALFMYVNFTYRTWNIGSLWTGHFWTLAVEEHFYILLSLTLLAVKKYRRLVPVVAALVGLYLAMTLPFAMEHAVRHGWYDPSYAPRSTQWQLVPLVLAAVAAVLVRRPGVLRVVKLGLRPWVAFCVTPLLMEAGILFDQLHGHVWPPRFNWDLRVELDQMATYLFILWIVATVFHPRSFTTRVLETRPMRFIGRISYSLYLWHVMVYDLWHQLLFSGNGPFTHLAHPWEHSLLERPARVAASFGVAVLSYYFIEKPMIRKGHKLAPPATPGRPELADLPVETPLHERAAAAHAAR